MWSQKFYQIMFNQPLQVYLLEPLSKMHTLKIVHSIANDKTRFKELVQCMDAADSKLALRASWTFRFCIEAHPQLFQPYWNKLIFWLTDPSKQSGFRRNILRAVYEIAVPKKLHAVLLNECFQLVQNTQEPAAVRVWSLYVLVKMSSDYPDIKEELTSLILLLLPNATSPAMKAACKNSIKQLK